MDKIRQAFITSKHEVLENNGNDLIGPDGNSASMPAELLSNVDVHATASVLKEYLRGLPEALIPGNNHQTFMDAVQCTVRFSCCQRKAY